MLLINFEIKIILIWSENCIITNPTGAQAFKITKIKLYLPVVTQLLSTQHNTKSLQQLK